MYQSEMTCRIPTLHMLILCILHFFFEHILILVQAAPEEIVTVASDIVDFEALLAAVNWLHGIRHAGHFPPAVIIGMWRYVPLMMSTNLIYWYASWIIRKVAACSESAVFLRRI